MTFVPLKVIGQCVSSDEELFSNMDAAIARGYPEILKQEPIRDGVIAIVASGPSIRGQVEVIRKMKETGTPIVAVRDAHDWLIRNVIIPDYAVSVDPLETAATCFTPHAGVHYLIASQSHKAMFDQLENCEVTIWHPFITKGQKRPKDRMVIGGATTSGLRAVSVFYVLGYRHFALFGLDSCLDNGVLRVNGTFPKNGDDISEVRIEPDGETFYCTPSMALQAQHFQTHYDWLPDATFYPYGHGLIQAIIRKREANAKELQALSDAPRITNERISFIHCGDRSTASYRYRAEIPAETLGASLNDLTADTLIFTKPQAYELMDMARTKARGGRVVVDFCDDHFEWTHYEEALRLADVVICPTQKMAEKIKGLGRDAHVIPDPFHFPRVEPHCNGVNLLWFGHAVNRDSFKRILPDLDGYPLRVVSNFGGAIPWSYETMLREFLTADIVVIPATAEYKSNNRALEAIRQGCFVVAEPHPSLTDIPGIWLGNIKEGIEWARQNPDIARAKTSVAQRYVTDTFSPQMVTAALRKAIKRPTTSAAEARNGTDG